jgi:trk system potassium uptake protein TrkH
MLPATALLLTFARAPAEAALRYEPAGGWDMVVHQPARLLVVTFLALCVLGTLLLSLPISSPHAAGISLVNAAFTAVSAVCVTGLIVLDTPVDFTGFGQAAILLLIQLGGLGIMTFSTAALGLLGRRLSLRYESAVVSALSVQGRHELFRDLRRLLTITFSAELIGTAVLSSLFAVEGEAPRQALWRGLFTSVSAFCNAGFALQSDSLIGYQRNPWILHTVALLIIIGGLSPAVVAALPDLLLRRRVAVQIKLAVVSTLVLLAGGAIAVTAIEWNNTLANLSLFDRLHNGWFQSVTLRTAGFNSIDIAAVHGSMLTLMMVWMFIGGSPGGTAGGIKTTTAALLALAVAAAIRGRWDVTVFRRRITTETVYKAAAIATLGFSMALLSLMALQLTQDLPGAQAPFEVVSALGTVGLSIGATARLDEVGKILIMATMFAGRVGPLTLFLFLSDRFSKSAWEFPDERIDVG